MPPSSSIDSKDPTLLNTATSTPTTTNGVSKPRGELDLTEKYSRLKKRYFELEQKQKDTTFELQKSGERNAQIRRERNIFLDRIVELEAHISSLSPSSGEPPLISGAFPRSLLSQRSQIAFTSNLRQAMNELEHEDMSVDPMLTSRHVGPTARKRQAEEDERRLEEEAREAKRPTRKTRSSAARNAQNNEVALQPPPPVSSPPLLVMNNGTRLRIKPHRIPADTNPPPPPPAEVIVKTQTRSVSPHSQSPISPIASPDAFPPAPNGNSPGTRASSTASANTLTTGPSELQRQTKPKRLKAHTVTTKSYSIPMVPRDKSGKPALPLNVGIMTVLNLGEICMREHFHTERYIFPVGYEVTRRYFSTIDPTTEVVYNCTIIDGGDGPKFQIIASDMPDKPIIAGTATGAWSGIVRAANLIRNRQHSNSVSGPDYFGLGQNTIKHLIQELPGADRLRDYVWQNFVEGGPLGGRHAAVIPALPDEHDGAVQLGQYYPTDREREREQERMKDRELERQIAESDPGYISPRARGSSQIRSPSLQQIDGQSGILSNPRKPRPDETEQPWIINEDPSTFGKRSDRSHSPIVRRESWSVQQAQSPSQTAGSNDSPVSTASIPPTLASIMHAYPPPPPSVNGDLKNGNMPTFNAYEPTSFSQ